MESDLALLGDGRAKELIAKVRDEIASIERDAKLATRAALTPRVRE